MSGSYIKLIPPSTKAIQGMIDAGSMSLRVALAELIANALDQDATLIEIKLDKKNRLFSISDNGNGCSDLEMMIQIGSDPAERKKGSIGRFGVGFKDAVIWLGDQVSIDSMTRS